MKVSADCTSCPFVKACPMVEEHQRLPWDEGGLELCPKLPEMKLLRCRNCIFLPQIQKHWRLRRICH